MGLNVAATGPVEFEPLTYRLLVPAACEVLAVQPLPVPPCPQVAEDAAIPGETWAARRNLTWPSPSR